jgi:hypothetical protein
MVVFKVEFGDVDKKMIRGGKKVRPEIFYFDSSLEKNFFFCHLPKTSEKADNVITLQSTCLKPKSQRLHETSAFIPEYTSSWALDRNESISLSTARNFDSERGMQVTALDISFGAIAGIPVIPENTVRKAPIAVLHLHANPNLRHGGNVSTTRR